MNSRDLASATNGVDRAWREEIVGELFHVVSQPLTGLHCLLEVALMKKQTASGYRRDIQAALEATSRLAESLRQARELAEADNPGNRELVLVSGLVGEVAEEFRPLLEASHYRAVISFEPKLRVSADPERLRRAVFYMFDCVLQDLPLGSELFITVKGDARAIIRIAPTAESDGEPCVPLAKQTRSLEVARRIARAAGGDVRFSEGAEGRSARMELPAARSAL